MMRTSIPRVSMDTWERTFYYASIVTALALVAVLTYRLLFRVPDAPELYAYDDDPRSEFVVYVRSPSDFGWATTLQAYEFSLHWMVDDAKVLLRSFQVRRGTRERGPEHDSFYRRGYLNADMTVGWGMKGTLESGRYRLGCRARSKYGWGPWRWKQITCERSLLLQPELVGGQVRAYLYTPQQTYEIG